MAMARIASVLLPLPLPEAFDYAEPEGMDLQVGDQVVAPLGPRRWIGVKEKSAPQRHEGHEDLVDLKAATLAAVERRNIYHEGHKVHEEVS